MGRGAASTILKIRRRADDRIYALKSYTVGSADDLKYIVQAENEFAVGKSLHHPNLAKVYALEISRKLFRVSGARVLIEYVCGLPLSECSQLPLYRLMRIFFKVADGLHYMHGQGFFHADLKPENVMVTPDVQVKVIDFGLAWRDGDKKDRVQGTLDYLAPEQARRKIVNARTDIFNFGATMYRVLSGKPVPGQLRDAETKKLGGGDTLVPLIQQSNSAVPNEMDEFVRQCIRLDPAERPKCMELVRDRLAEIGKQIKSNMRAGNEDD